MRWFNNLKATPRLMIGFGVVLVLTLVIGYLSISNLSSANDRVESMYSSSVVGLDAADTLSIDVATASHLILHAIVHQDDQDIIANDEKEASLALADMLANTDKAEKHTTNKQTLDHIAILRKTIPDFEQATKGAFQKLKAKDVNGAMAALPGLADMRKSLRDLGDKIGQEKQDSADQRYQESMQSYKSSRSLTLGACILSLALGIILALVIARGFARPLGEAVEALRKVADGDLTTYLDVDTEDEIGEMAAALNEAVKKLHATLEQVTEGAMASSASSQQLASASQAIASGAQEQAASLEETSASLEEITATVRQSADNARQASQLASSSRDSAEHGQEVVSNAVTAMSEINASSAKIADIIGTIDEIAFQTNLLAVNAAVEAARAGEEGRGFAVVATEVRSLAQRSAEAAKEIKVLIQDSLRKVERGTNLVNKSGETLQAIVSSVKRVTDIVSEIAAAAGEQSTGIEQVNTAMMQMDQVTQANSAQTEELSSTAESMSDQAERLMKQVSIFTLNKDGKQAYASTSPKKAVHASVHFATPAAKTHAKIGTKIAAAVKKVSAPSAGVPSVTPQPAVAAAHAAASGGSEASFEEF
jgi:methyl-accepting chemotaxis protein